MSYVCANDYKILEDENNQLKKEIQELKDRNFSLENKTDEETELRLKNEGADSLAKLLLTDTGHGEMNQGPCADILELVRWLKARIDQAGKDIEKLKEHNNEIYNDNLFLTALESAGVDNWQGYDDAREIYNNLKKESEADAD